MDANKTLEEFWSLSDKFNRIEDDYDYKLQDEIFEKSNQLFDILFFQENLEKPFYWIHCPIKVYRETLDKRITEFIDSPQEPSVLDFFKHEWMELEQYYIDHFEGYLLDFLGQHNRDLCLEEDGKKRKLILERLKSLGAIPVTRKHNDINDYGTRETYIIREWEYFDVITPVNSKTNQKNITKINAVAMVYFFYEIGLKEKMNNAGYTSEDVYLKIAELTGTHRQTIKDQYRRIAKAKNDLVGTIRDVKTKTSILEIEKLIKHIGKL